MSYKALYRVYRPKTFSEVVGQKHIVTVLKSQVISGQISHAYLFTGSRGTGKTSIAKIFARSISCLENHDGEACLKCQLCKDTFNDASIDVIEIDAASNNGVDEIRELRENVKYAPVTGKYKVYIIDEVHMLTLHAFNALLKTLEEPPAHAVFILATTDPQRLPETIISRCQRYDFERIDREAIADRLEYICSQEKASCDRSALLMISDFSKGGLRDAISLLDQCIAFSGGSITDTAVLELLGKSEDEALFNIGDMLIDKDGSGLVVYINSLIKKGQNVSVLTGDIIDHLRKLMLFKTTEHPEQIADVVRITEYQNQSKRADLHMLLRGIKVLSAAMAEMRYAFSPIVILEVALMDICTPTASDDNLAILQRLSELENMVKSGVQIAPKVQPIVIEQPSAKDENEDAVPWREDEIPSQSIEDEGVFIMEETAEKKPSVKKAEKENPKGNNDDNLGTAKVMGSSFTSADYNEFLNRMKVNNKGVYISLGNSFFGGFENGTLTIGYPDESHDIFMKAVEAKKSDIIKTLADMGFKDCEVCVKILKQDKTEYLKEMFGDNIKFID